MAAARDKRGTDEHVVCIFGDAALTNGISFEALNNLAHTTKRFIGILNDNEWSIAKNVGAVANYLNKLITNPRYNKLATDFQNFLRRFPKGEVAIKLARKAEEGFKGAITEVGLRQTGSLVEADGRGGYGSPVFFEEMGLRYLGPIDGHDLPLLISTLEFAKTCDHPIVIHVLTQKGKGYDAAIKSPEKFHGVGPYDVATGNTVPAKPGTPPMYQDVMGQTLVKLCQKDNTLVGITAAMPSGTGLKHLEKAMPDRYYDVGIAEEHAVIFAAGMATMGFHPVVAIYSTFLQRAYDCIHHDVCLQDLPVIFCMDRAGLSANDGPTHHGLFDIAYLRCLPNVIAMAPKDEDELADMMFTADAPAASGLHSLSARRGGGRAHQGPAGAARSRQGGSGAEFLRPGQAQGGAVRAGQHEHRRPQGGGATGRRRLRLRRHQSALHQAAGRRDARIFRPRGGGGGHAGRPCAHGRLRCGGAGIVQRRRCQRRQSCASAGRISSSSTPPRRTNCARNTA